MYQIQHFTFVEVCKIPKNISPKLYLSSILVLILCLLIDVVLHYLFK